LLDASPLPRFKLPVALGRTTLIALLAVATLAPAAAAQEEGVFVDPDSPAGKEYAIPLDQARRDAAGGGNAARGSEDGGQSLFGTGITPAEGSGRGSGSPDGGPDVAQSPAAGERSSDDRRPQKRKGSAEREDALGDAPRAAVVEPRAGGSDTVPTAGVAVGVLGAGLLAGFGLRKLLRSH
jgi:hypothetical protein